METDEKRGSLSDRIFTSVNVLMMIAAVCALVLIFEWVDTRNQIGKLQVELASRLATAESYNRESRQKAGQALDAERGSEVRLGILEKKMAESQNQQVALEAMYQELARNRDEYALAEVEQILLIANEQLQLAGNVKTALIALGNADNTLQRIDRPELLGLRKAISRDIEKLRGADEVDLSGVSLHLDNILAAVDSMPLAMEARPHPAALQPQSETGVWEKFGRQVWDDIKQLIRIQNMQNREIPPLAPSQAYFLRENLKLRLLSARLSLLAHDQVGFRSDLKTAQQWIDLYFDRDSRQTRSALTNLRQIYGSEISIDRLDINDSLSAVHNFRLARERSVR